VVGRQISVAVLAAAAMGTVVGCGDSQGLSTAQIGSLKAHVAEFGIGLDGATKTMAECKRRGGSVTSLSNCLGRAMDDVSGHVNDIAAFTEGLAASTGGACKVQLAALSAAMTVQSKLFAKAGDQARAQQFDGLKRSLNSVSSAAITRFGKSADTACS